MLKMDLTERRYQNVARFRDQTDGMIHADVQSSSGVRLELVLSGSSSLLIPNREEARHNWVCCPMEEIMEELRWSKEIVRKTLERVPHESIRNHVAKVTYTKLEQQTRTCLSIAMVSWLEALHRHGAEHGWLLNSTEEVDRLFLGIAITIFLIRAGSDLDWSVSLQGHPHEIFTM